MNVVLRKGASKQHPVALLVEGLATYSRIHGHCGVPRQYTVPSDDRYACHLHGVDLGDLAEYLRRLTKQCQERLETTMQDVGFVWAMYPGDVRCYFQPRGEFRRVPTKVLVDALCVYHRLHGHTYMPDGFCIPETPSAWPLSLGSADLVFAIDEVTRHVFELPEAYVAKLHGIGRCRFAPLWPDFIAQLQTFKDVHGALDIPMDFSIPASTPWRREWRGAPLGDVAYKVHMLTPTLLRRYRDDLRAMGLMSRTATTYARVLDALCIFRSLYGGQGVPECFQVPFKNDMWPAALWGMRLGRYRRCTEAALHYRWVPPEARDAYDERMRLYHDIRRYNPLDNCASVFAMYRREVGHVAIPADFVAPAHWRSKIDRLGARAEAYRAARTAGTIDALDKATLVDLGFVWDLAFHALWPDILAFFKLWAAHRRQHEALHDDVVLTTSNDVPWPPALLQQPICYYLTLLDVHEDAAAPSRRCILEAFGFDYDQRWQTKLEALECYRLEHGHVDVPTDFIVPCTDEASTWPSALRGLRLGDIVVWLRQLRPHMEERKVVELDALGFVWELSTPASSPTLTLETSALNSGLKRKALATSPRIVVDLTHDDDDILDLEDDASSPKKRRRADSDDDAKDMDDVNWSHCVLGLMLFKSTFGDFDVARTFDVPADDVKWPKMLWRLPLGRIVRALQRRHIAPPSSTRLHLLAMGVPWLPTPK